MLHQTFQTFVQNPRDLAGLIAYALYKADKVEFMRMHPDADVHGFVLSMNLPSQVDTYRTRAEIMLEDMAEESLSGALEEAEADHLRRLRRLETTLGFWSGVWSSVLANLIAAGISILLVVLVLGSKLNFWTGLLKYLSE
ncbi:hypothetical protein CS062_20350 [Roseateles chitinivorans]|uniref:Uncharacterized protein n=1 Tax=Roseateles chitinivorans TaxID=2917965 RepID=A0A2G9C4S4_9BURK|nr:hypothetical protein [Roseateles chitinivorans]PIM51352.1 hypothetical protein CS062_20350 [Roseateles chitinivorans]